MVIGEATKNIPDEIRQANVQIEWRKMAGMRDMINDEIVWDVVKNKIPILKRQIEQLLKD